MPTIQKPGAHYVPPEKKGGLILSQKKPVDLERKKKEAAQSGRLKALG